MYRNLIARSNLQQAGPVRDPELDGIAIAGTPADCAESIATLHAAGASSIVVVPIGPDTNQQLARLAGEVLPLLDARS
jgi:alkanesulfonate monooxygenase SsuD/methylene tetrahydromethanopterin reductase-like flavin-dependent oxidoreductase (luciferase family)